MKVNIEGTVEFDPVKEDLEGRIDEIIEDEEYEPDEELEVRQEARDEAIRIIVDELIGQTGFEINYISRQYR